MRHVYGRDPERALQLLKLGARFHAQFGVEIGEGFIEQEQTRLANDGAGQRAALLLAARQLAGLAVEQMLDLDLARGFLHREIYLDRRKLGHFQRKGDVFVHGHVGVERVALEYHGDVAVARIRGRDIPAVHVHAARRRRVQAGQNPQRRALARAGWAQQRKELAGLDVERHAFQRAELAVHFDDIFKTYLTSTGHRRPPPLTAPTVRPLTMFFWAIMPRMTTGSIASTETAASFAHSVCSTDTKLNIATVTGRTVLPLRTTANRN